MAFAICAAAAPSIHGTAAGDAPGMQAGALHERLLRSGFTRLADFQGLQAWLADGDGLTRLVLVRAAEERIRGVVEDLFFANAEHAAGLFLAATNELPDTPDTVKHLMQFCPTGRVRESVGLQTGSSFRVELNHALVPSIELTGADQGDLDAMAFQATQWQAAAIGEKGKQARLPERLIELLGNTVKSPAGAAQCPEKSGAFPSEKLPLPGLSQQEFNAHGQGEGGKEIILWLDDEKHGVQFEPTWRDGRLLRWQGRAVIQEDAIEGWTESVKALEAELGPPAERQYTQQTTGVRTLERWWFNDGVSLELALTTTDDGDSMTLVLTGQVN